MNGRAARARAAARRTDAGFTLVELVMTVAMVGILVPALAAIVFGYFKTTNSTQSRLTESQDVQVVSAYWQRDVASIGVRGAYDTGTKTFPLQTSVGVTPACTVPTRSGDEIVTTLGWSDYASLDSTATPKLVTVTYFTRPRNGALELYRARCDGSTLTSSITVADTLAATSAPTVTCSLRSGGATTSPAPTSSPSPKAAAAPEFSAAKCPGAGADVPAVVRLSLAVQDVAGKSTTSYAVDLDGQRRQS